MSVWESTRLRRGMRRPLSCTNRRLLCMDRRPWSMKRRPSCTVRLQWSTVRRQLFMAPRLDFHLTVPQAFIAGPIGAKGSGAGVNGKSGTAKIAVGTTVTIAGVRE